MKKSATLLIAVVFLVAGYLVYNQYRPSNQDQNALENLETAVVQVGDLKMAIEATGIVRANHTATLSWETPGEVGSVEVEPGELVAQGQALAALEQSSLLPNVILAQSDLYAAQQALEDLKNSQAQRALALLAVEQAEQALEDALNPALSQAESLQGLAAAEKAVEDAQRNLAILTKAATQAVIDQAYANLLLAKDKLDATLEQIADTEWKLKKYSASPYLPDEVKSDLRKSLKKALEGLEIQRTQDQLAYDKSLNRYNQLLAPPDPVDVSIAEAEQATAEAQLAEARKAYERIQSGASNGEISLLEAELEDANREWERLKDGPDPEEIAAAQARVAAAQATLAQTRITAPFDGVVTVVDSKPGDQVGAGSSAFRVDDLSKLLVDLDVSEVDINQIAAGQAVSLSFDAIRGAEYHGQVAEVALVGTGSGGVVSFRVTVELTDADEAVKTGMTSAVSIEVNQIRGVMLVPNQSVRVVDGERVVYVLVDEASRVQAKEITLGISSEGFSQVLTGSLQAGDQVILNPSQDLESTPGGSG